MRTEAKSVTVTCSPKKKPTFILLVAATCWMTGCATYATMRTLSTSERDDMQTSFYDQPDSTIYSATTTALLDMGFSLQMSDRSTYTVQTASLEYPPNTDQDALAVALVGYPIRYRRSISARVRDGKLRLNIAWESTDRYGWRPYDARVDVARSEYVDVFGRVGADLGSKKHGTNDPRQGLNDAAKGSQERGGK